jgi:hypothetical protein
MGDPLSDLALGLMRVRLLAAGLVTAGLVTAGVEVLRTCDHEGVWVFEGFCDPMDFGGPTAGFMTVGLLATAELMTAGLVVAGLVTAGVETPRACEHEVAW